MTEPNARAAARRRRSRALAALATLLGAAALACQSPPPVCQCDCSFKATAPQVGKGCWVEGDKLICPLVRRSLEIEPAYPSEDPRCVTREDGTIECAIHPGDEVPHGDSP